MMLLKYDGKYLLSPNIFFFLKFFVYENEKTASVFGFILSLAIHAMEFGHSHICFSSTSLACPYFVPLRVVSLNINLLLKLRILERIFQDKKSKVIDSPQNFVAQN